MSVEDPEATPSDAATEEASSDEAPSGPATPVEILAQASREHSGSGAFTVLAPAYEDRRIVIAYGLQFHADEIDPQYVLDTYLTAKLGRYPDVEKVSASEYLNHAQRVRFLITETTDKTEFRTYLETPGIHVVYDGHARWGRGPCFGRNWNPPSHDVRPSDDWEEGTTPATTGIFRMGYPYVPTTVNEVLEHGYHANLMKESEGVPARDDSHPSLRAHRSSLRARTPEQIHADLLPLLRSHTDGDKYWTYGAFDEGARRRHVIHHAGWQNTLSTRFDLEATDMRCRVFCHFGCDTFLSNYRVVRFLYDWKRDGNDRYAYWTTASSYDGTFTRWVLHLITYGEENAFQSWEPSLRYAVGRINRDLRRDGYRYRII